MDGALERAIATPGTRVSMTFADRRWYDALITARNVALGVLWVALGVAAVWASVRGIAWFGEWRAVRAERCRRCGYSLTGLSDGSPCPECGDPAARPADPYVERLKKKQWPSDGRAGP